MTTRILLTNDDGIDSPAMPAFVAALEQLGEVTVVAPSRERSWVGKAISRQDPVTMSSVLRDGREMYAVNGFPADCTQLGIDLHGDTGPDLVVSGINIGFNHGEAFLLSSGTVGAAFEAAIRGIPAVAVSAGTNGHWPTWHEMAWSPVSRSMWARLAPLAAGVIEPIVRLGFPPGADVVSINLPQDATVSSERRITSIAPTRYDSLFAPGPDGVFQHAVRGHRVEGDVAGTDIEASRQGLISITAVKLPATGEMSPELAEAWDAGGPDITVPGRAGREGR